MAGHSHWAGIKHKKGAADAKRGKLFSKLAKGIIVAVRERGDDPDANISLKYAIDRAKAQNMPKDVIERAIRRGSGKLDDGATYSELVYEGFGPHKVAFVVDIVTDNRNRTASELRKIFERRGGLLASPGSVAWMFETKGVLEVLQSAIDEESLMELTLEAGAEDIKSEGDCFQVLTAPESFSAVRQALLEREIPTSFAEICRQPTTTVEIQESKSARQLIDFLNDLEEHEDVQRVSANFDIPDAMLQDLE